MKKRIENVFKAKSISISKKGKEMILFNVN